MEYATAHDGKRAKREWKRHCSDKRTQDAKAVQKLTELERQHGQQTQVSFEQAKARTKILEASLLR